MFYSRMVVFKSGCISAKVWISDVLVSTVCGGAGGAFSKMWMFGIKMVIDL